MFTNFFTQLTQPRPLDIFSTFSTFSSPQTTPTPGSSTKVSHVPVPAPARYAVRQALDQEYQNYIRRQRADARQARYEAGGGDPTDEIADGVPKTSTASASASAAIAVTSASASVKRDFFGRLLLQASSDDESTSATGTGVGAGGMTKSRISAVEEEKRKREARVWVSYHEGFSNAVRKPVSLKEILSGL